MDPQQPLYVRNNRSLRRQLLPIPNLLAWICFAMLLTTMCRMLSVARLVGSAAGVLGAAMKG